MPLIIWLHGLGASGEDLMPAAAALQNYLGNQITFESLFPTAPLRSITINGGIKMNGWYDIIGLSLEAREDKEGITHSANLISKIITDKIENGYKSEDIFLAGFSQGGALAMYTGLSLQHNLAGIISLSAYLPLASNIVISQNKKIPIFLGSGKYDSVVNPTWTSWMHNWLVHENYVNISNNIYPIDHSISDQEIQDISFWLKNIKGNA